MSDVAELEAPATSTAIALVVSQTPVVVLVDEKSRADFYAHIQAEVDSFEPDISTAKGRDEIKSLAYKITRTKTAIDAAGKELNEEARAKINAVDAERRAVKAHFEALAEKVRKPLTDWEVAEKKREAEVERIIGLFRSARFVPMGEAADSIRERGTAVHETEIDPDLFRDRAEEAEREKNDTVEHLFAALKAAEQAEKDRAELERLQKEAAEREAEEQAKREAEEAEARRVEAARIAEEQRVAAEKAEQERIAAAQREAEERARREAEDAAEAERQRVQREHEEQLAAERERAAAAEREAQAQRDRIAAEEAERERVAQVEADAKAKREADQAHRTAVKTKAKEALMTCGADEETAKKIVVAIIAGEIPAVGIAF